MAEGVQRKLAGLLSTRVRDPRIAGVVVSRVEMTDDLRLVKVYVRLLSGGDEAAKRHEVVEGLTRAGGMLRKEVAAEVGLRYVPELRFYYDAGADGVTRIEEILTEIEAEDRTKK